MSCFTLNSKIPCSICTKLHMFDQSPDLKTSTCQYFVIVIAPPAGSRKFGTYEWLWHISPIFTTLNAYLLWPRELNTLMKMLSWFAGAFSVCMCFLKLQRVELSRPHRDVTINREPVENRFIYVTIQNNWDAKQIVIQLGVGVYMNVCLRGTYCL